jgi:hypothetical protein
MNRIAPRFAWRRAGGFGAAMVVCASLWLGPADAQLPPPAPPAGAAPSSAAPPSITAVECGACGKVESIRQTTQQQQWTPLGTGVGVGGTPSLGEAPAGVTSYRIGPGLSNQGMVVLGAAGGASYKRTPSSYEQRRWDVTVRLDGGGTRIVSLSYEPYVREGDRVRIAGNNVELLEE